MGRFFRNNFGLALICVLTLIPIVMWLAIEPLSFRFQNPGFILRSIGQITGLVGVALFAVTLVLGTRAEFLDGIFYGINNSYDYHHILGGISFILLLFHPVALAIRYVLISAGAAFGFLMSGDFTVLAGEAALTLMIIFLTLTFFAKLRYEVWKFSHKFLALAFFAASLHVFYISSDVAESTVLRAYIGILILSGFWAILYRTIFPGFFVKRYDYIIDEVRPVTANSFEIVMSAIGEKMSYQPGQFLFLNFRSKKIEKEIHPFSMSSAPSDDKLRIAVKELGDFSSHVKSLKAGDTARVEGPFGRFSYLNFPVHKNQIWVAGGIGIAPFISMARSLNIAADYKIDLYYCVNKRDELSFFGELEEISKKYGNLRIFPFCLDEKGLITADKIKESSNGLAEKEIFICGPVIMIESLRNQLIKLGVKRRDIHTEEFKLY